MNILLIAHACGPNRGSEPGTGWNLAWELAADHTVHVITHPQHAEEIDAYLVANPRPNLHFIYVNLPPKIDTWQPKRGEKGLKLHYILWQHFAAKRARTMCAELPIDVVHHVTLGTINAPPVLHKIPVPVVWGPLGGGQTTPMAFKDYFRGHVLPERLRHVMAWALPFSPPLRRMAKKSSIALAKNRETLDLLERAGARRSQFLLDCGLPPNYAKDVADRSRDGLIELLWAGRLEQRKAPRLAIEAIAQVRDLPVRLSFVGDGPLTDEIKNQIRDLNLGDRVRLLGKLPYQEMANQFRASHALLFTSLRDSTGCVVLEAMAYGLPIITLNHQGVACFVPDAASVKVPVTTPAETIKGLAEAIRVISNDPEKCQAMSIASVEGAKRETWDQRAKIIAGWYAEIVR